MPAILVITYDITDPDRFADYNPGKLAEIGATIAKHGGRTTFAAPPETLVGDASQIAIGIEFPDADAAKAWLVDDEYAPLMAIRLEATDNVSTYVVPTMG